MGVAGSKVGKPLKQARFKIEPQRTYIYIYSTCVYTYIYMIYKDLLGFWQCLPSRWRFFHIEVLTR